MCAPLQSESFLLEPNPHLASKSIFMSVVTYLIWLTHRGAERVHRYFVPRNITALDRSSHPSYVFERPSAGWKSWSPDENTSRRSNFIPLRSNEHHRSAGPSQQEKSHATNVEPVAMSSPKSSFIKPNIPDLNDIQPVKLDRDLSQRKRRPLSPVGASSAEQRLPLDAPIPITDLASISTAIRSLSKALIPITPTATGPSTTQSAPVSAQYIADS